MPSKSKLNWGAFFAPRLEKVFVHEIGKKLAGCTMLRRKAMFLQRDLESAAMARESIGLELHIKKRSPNLRKEPVRVEGSIIGRLLAIPPPPKHGQHYPPAMLAPKVELGRRREA